MKPVKPDDSDCCGSGCKPCIFDVYEERLKKWIAKEKENFAQSKALDQIKYLPFLITNIEDVGDLIKIIKFQAVVFKNEKNTNLSQIENAQSDIEIFEEPLKIKTGEYLILKGSFENDTISRSYTPVLDEENFDKGVFTIIISLQADGKMCQFLKMLKTNDVVFWRGPFLEFSKNINPFKHILLFGGGTGVVPLYNIAKTIVEDEENEIWVKVFTCFKSTNNIILRKEFAKLKDYWNFQISTFITNSNQSDFKAGYNESIIFKRIDETVIGNELENCKSGEIFVVVCGPQGFNHFIVNSLKKYGIHDENIFIFW